jgi:NAD(P)H-hydrate epimerase
LGTHPDTAQGLKTLIGDYGGNLIFDADAINILAENKTWLEFLPPNCIFTPHHKEFERLTRKANNDFDRLELQREFSVQHRCVVILKGAYTSISTQYGGIYFNPSGNPGMAKGGCGDVLTGMLLALMAQGYTSIQAATIGVYLHGLVADKSIGKQSYESLLPSDIAANIGNGFMTLFKE